jgi:COP9 signalosome complex subunit 6
MAKDMVNTLISAQKSGDSSLQIALHPLPVLEISDYITRSYMRGYKGAIVGALLGQQNGRDVTIEFSFTCKSAKKPSGFYELDEEWFLARLEQSE